MKLRWFVLVALVLGVGFTPSLGGAQGGRRQRERQDDANDAVVEAMTGWTRLGERIVRHGVDHDTIMVTGAQGRFRSIALRVEHSSLELYNIVITFGDGSTFSPTTRLVFAENTESRTIDLPGELRVIRRVDFYYANIPAGGRAQMELWAR